MNTHNRPTLRYAHLIGEGIGIDFAKALEILATGIPTIDFDPVLIKDFRDAQGNLNSETVQIFKDCRFGMKGPTATQEGTGPKSINVALRKELELYANIRPVSWIPGVNTPVKNPEKLSVTIFRQNTEDLYMGIEAQAGTRMVEKLYKMLHEHWNIDTDELPDVTLTGAGIKLLSQPATEQIMDAAIQYAIEHGKKKICIACKSNIMKYTEGAFKNWGMQYAKDNYRDKVYCKDEVADFSEAEKAKRIYIDTVITDDAFAQLLIHPERFEIIVTPNLNGDYLSDAAAAQVGGVPTAAGANIGDTYAVFEAIGGTADDIAGKDIANPTAFLLAFAMMLDHAKFPAEATAIRKSIAALYANGIGTADMNFETKLSTSEFAKKLAIIVEQQFPVPVES